MRSGNSLYWVFQISGWGCFAVINILLAIFFEKMADEASQRIVLSRFGLFVLLGIICTHFMRAVIIRMNVLQKTIDKQIAQFFFITIAFSLISATLYMQISQYFGLLNEIEKRFFDRPALLILGSAFYFLVNIFIWNLIYFIYHYVASNRKRQRDLPGLEILVKELELNIHNINRQ